MKAAVTSFQLWADNIKFATAHNGRGLNEQDSVRNNRDSIHGYSISTIFNQMGENTKLAATLINNLRGMLPTGVGNTLANYDSLRSAYGYR
jgi:hypothetical protein